jgi:glycosyltransferase involved in cell wall biosynthesis
MTAYNREDFLGEAIESVLASTYENFELIIVDDRSKDNTLQIARGYAEKDSRIRVFENEKNLGDYPNRNKAAGYATGDILMTVDSDDTLYPDSIEKCVSLSDRFPSVHFGICSETSGDSPSLMTATAAIHDHFFKLPLLLKGPGGTFMKRNFFNRIGGYPEKYGPANDMYFNLKAASQTDVLLIPFEFIFYRRHEGQEINNSDSYLFNSYRYLRDALSELDLPVSKKEIAWLQKKNKRRFSVNIIKYVFKTRNISKTRLAIKSAGFGFNDFLIGIFH